MRSLLLFLLASALNGQATKSMFDGKSLDGWMWSLDDAPPQPSWAAADGILRTTPGQGKQVYLITRESFRDFDIEFEFNAAKGANSGVKYRFQGYWVMAQAEPRPPQPGDSVEPQPGGAGRIEPIALEYQIADDDTNPDATTDDKHSTAALYEYWPAAKNGPAHANEWHRGRIVVRGLHIEHWLDGRKVVDVELDSPALKSAFAASPRKRSSPLLARQERRDSPLALQFHTGVVMFRNLKIRAL